MALENSAEFCILVLLFALNIYVGVNIFFSDVGTGLPGLNQY